MSVNMLSGIRRSGGIVNIAAGLAAGATVLYRISNWANQVGTRSFIVRKLWVRNNATGAGWFALGTGVGAGVAVYPHFWLLNNIDNEWNEVDIPAIEMWEDLVGFTIAAYVGGGSLDAAVEVEERS
jgi:hypothetical protein